MDGTIAMFPRAQDSLDSLSRDADELLVKQLVVHRQANRRHQGEPLVSLGIVDHASRVGERDRVRHVDSDGVAVSQGNGRGELERGRPRVTERNHSVKSELVEVGRLELWAKSALILKLRRDETG